MAFSGDPGSEGGRGPEVLLHSCRVTNPQLSSKKDSPSKLLDHEIRAFCIFLTDITRFEAVNAMLQTISPMGFQTSLSGHQFLAALVSVRRQGAGIEEEL